jgi:predicted nucleic acid-binding protein
MTSSQIRRVYWDTGLFLCFLNKDEQDRREICEDNLRHARAGNIEIYTSYWTAVEVIKPKWIPKFVPLTDEQVEMIQGMFQWPFLKKIQVHQTVSFAAADLSRKFGLKPADAIHAASAMFKKVDAMQVFDRDFKAISHLITVEEPRLLTPRPPLIAAMMEEPIGPTPQKIEAAQAPPNLLTLIADPTAPTPPSVQSLAVEKLKETEPAPVRPSSPLDAQAQPLPDSSPIAAPPPQSEK